MSVSWLNSGIAAFKEWLARSDAASPRERLRAEIEAEIDENPWPAEGAVWAARPPQWWADRLGCSVSTVRRTVKDLVKAKLIKTVVKQVDGPKMLLYRLGSPDEKSPEDYARMMVAVWRKHWRTNGKRETPTDFGRFVELGKHWKAQGPAILKTVLDDWPGFMQCVELHQLETGEGEKKYYDFPSTSVIGKYRSVAADHHKFKLQEASAAKLVKPV